MKITGKLFANNLPAPLDLEFILNIKAESGWLEEADEEDDAPDEED